MLPGPSGGQPEQRRAVTDPETVAPPVLLVGVWSEGEDQATPTEIELQQMRQRLQHVFQGQLCGRHVHGEVFTLPLSRAASQLAALRACAARLMLAQAHMGERVPVRWLSLEEEVARRVRAGLVVATLDEVETMAAEHEVAGEELTTFLQFHHDQGSLLYHGDAEHRLVLLSPQWLVQLIADVIRAKRKYYQSAPSGWRRLETEGVVEAGLLTRQWDDLTSDAVSLGVLQRLGLLCQLAPPPGLYDLADSVALPKMLLMPCLITSRADSTESTRDSADAFTFYIDFCGFLPA
ncbi:uncharacterized protein LOC119089962 [Pollicipes pollicipes]|uniref:uncharacterized protein LOC119089962 n=1 Tax=Pollicipes pollicipes TaxID=41117 RepID=UPI001884FC48|nr:uncharacterized protein LOC119089962 [Pollicipes pollicipes]